MSEDTKYTNHSITISQDTLIRLLREDGWEIPMGPHGDGHRKTPKEPDSKVCSSQPGTGVSIDVICDQCGHEETQAKYNIYTVKVEWNTWPREEEEEVSDDR